MPEPMPCSVTDGEQYDDWLEKRYPDEVVEDAYDVWKAYHEESDDE